MPPSCPHPLQGYAALRAGFPVGRLAMLWLWMALFGLGSAWALASTLGGAGPMERDTALDEVRAVAAYAHAPEANVLAQVRNLSAEVIDQVADVDELPVLRLAGVSRSVARPVQHRWAMECLGVEPGLRPPRALG